MQAKRQKLQTQYGSTAPRKTADSEQKSEIFKGVAIYVNGYTSNITFNHSILMCVIDFTVSN